MSYAGRLAWLMLLVAVLAACSSQARRGTAPADLAGALREADAQYAAGQPAAAAALYLDVVQQVPDNADLWMKLGNAYTRAERPVEAARAYEQVVAREPASAQGWYNLGVVLTRQAHGAFARASSRSTADQPVGMEGRRMWKALSEVLAPSDHPQGMQEE